MLKRLLLDKEGRASIMKFLMFGMVLRVETLISGRFICLKGFVF